MPKTWFPLESNPAVISTYAEKLGLSTTDFTYTDVFSVEPWALSMVPRPVVGVLMLFPVNEASEEHRRVEGERIRAHGQLVSPNVYFMKQTVGNACGTVGILHSLLNSLNKINVAPNSYIERFLTETVAMSPDERATYLELDDEIEETHGAAAAEGQSEQNEGEVDAHFICFRLFFMKLVHCFCLCL
jgi:ubiquitin carboxyl-terminal hydrolase L3